MNALSPARQTYTGLILAAAIIGGWLAVHVAAVFAFPLAHAASSPALMAGATGLVLLESWLGAGMFIVAHDAMHGSLAPGRRRLNVAIGQLALGLYAGFPYGELEAKHHLHHRHAGAEGDPDFHADRPLEFWRWYAKFFREYWHWPQQLAITGVMLTYALLGANPLNMAIFWGLPAILSSLQLFTFGTWLPHRHERTGAAFADGHNARSLDYPWLLSLLTCFHFGHHLEHHHSPGTPWWRLPAYARGFIAR